MEPPFTQIEDFLRREGETRRILGTAKPAAYQRWSYKSIEAAATKFTSAAIASHEELKEIITNFFPHISLRWSKKTKKQRTSLLLSVRPNMPAGACEDLKLLCNRKTRKLTEQQKNTFLCPQINLEQLTDGQSLLMWMFSRAQHAPHYFVRSDLIRTNLLENGTDLMIFQPNGLGSLSGRLMRINLMNKPKLYGVAISFSGSTFEEMFARDDMMVCGLGVRVFEAQAMLTDFLVKMCQAILHDQPTLQRTFQPQLLTAPSFPLISGSDVPAILTNVLRRSYLSAVGSGFTDLATIVTSRYETLEDHTWSLREDPDCFVDWVNNIKANTYVGDLRGGRGIEQIFPELVRNRFETLFTNLLIWSALRDAMMRLVNTIRRHDGKLDDGTALYQDVAVELIRLSSIVVPYLKVLTQFTTVAYFCSPQHQKNYIFGDASKVQVTPRPGRQLSAEAKHIEWLMFALKDGKADYWGYAGFVVEIGKYLNSKDPAAKELHSPLTSEHLIDLAIFISLRTELERCTHMLPQAFSTYSAYMQANDNVKKEKLLERCTVQMPFREDFMAICNPKDGKIRYPAHKAPTKASIEMMGDSEANLHGIWTILIYVMKETKTMPLELAKFFVSRKLSSTPELVEPTRVSPLQPNDVHGTEKQVAGPLGPQAAMAEAKRNFQAPAAKIKEKTRATARNNEDEQQPQTQAASPNTVKQEQVMHVDKRALKVFRILFYTPAAHSQPGETNWKDFLYAMTSIGFSAVHLYGSVWQFSSNKYGAIQFHDPHAPKMRFNDARRIGRRLARKYGWSGEMFQLQ